MENLFTITRKDGSGVIIWSEDQKRFIIEEYQVRDNTLTNIAKMFNVRMEAIRNLLRKEGISITNKKIRNYPRDSHYFDNINTPDKAYWLGIMYSDGTVGKKNEVALGLKDKEHVEKFKLAIGAINHKISEVVDKRFSKPCYMYDFSIHDQGIYDGLVKYGVLNNKSYKIFGLPDIKDKDLMRHFIRGYYDGDGGLSYSIKDPFCKSTFSLSFTGNKQFLTELKGYLGLEKISLEQNSVSKITYQLKIRGRQQVLSLLEWLYKDTDEKIRLDRKYNKYIELSSYQAHNPRTLKSRVWPSL